MPRRPTLPRPALVLCLLAATASLAAAQSVPDPTPSATLDSSAGPLRIDAMVTGLVEPWSIGFLPDGGLVVTERDGRLLLVRDGQVQPIAGVPAIRAEGQGGLLDVMVPRDFATTRTLWLSFAAPSGAGAATAAGSGRLSEDGRRLEGFVTHWQGQGGPGGRHFGSRLVEAPDGSVFLTTGDRGTGPDGMQAQNPSRPEGKVIRLHPDGSPFTAPPGHAPGVHSLGHRNPQGAALDAQGQLWIVDHGAAGGDELNRIEAGRNYGWPVITYGRDYDGGRIGRGTAQDGMEQPAHYWDPSIAPSGLMIYRGDLFPQWRGDVFTGSLNADFISRLDPDAAHAEERLAAPQTGRVRDIKQAPDGTIWFLSVLDGAAYRLAPAP